MLRIWCLDNELYQEQPWEGSPSFQEEGAHVLQPQLLYCWQVASDYKPWFQKEITLDEEVWDRV